ncbi:hypothetical protein AGMMS49991_07050 [Spirochaetia bacterium]|nr:hypothetical protein AGMMS49991_07050 [Spirochaetia bacterium]
MDVEKLEESVIDQLDSLIRFREAQAKSNPEDANLLFELGRAYLTKSLLWDKSKSHNEETCFQKAIDNFEKAQQECKKSETEYQLYKDFAEKVKDLDELD